MREFKPAILFLVKFLGIYFAGNILYGVFVESYGSKPDLATEVVSWQTATCLTSLGGHEVSAEVNPDGPTVFLKEKDRMVLSVFEGCNGVNVMIIFVAFIVAFGGTPGKIAIYIPTGLLIIHAFNLLRVALLFYVAKQYEQYFYYLHKYAFTAVLYVVVLALWAVWVFKFNGVKK